MARIKIDAQAHALLQSFAVGTMTGATLLDDGFYSINVDAEVKRQLDSLVDVYDLKTYSEAVRYLTGIFGKKQ